MKKATLCFPEKHTGFFEIPQQKNLSLSVLNLIAYLGTFCNAGGDVHVIALTFTTGL